MTDTDRPLSRRERREMAERASTQPEESSRALPDPGPVGPGSGKADDGHVLSRKERRRLERLERPMETWTAEEEMRVTGQTPKMTPEVIAQQEELARKKAAEAQLDAELHTGENQTLVAGQVSPAAAAEVTGEPLPEPQPDPAQEAKPEPPKPPVEIVSGEPIPPEATPKPGEVPPELAHLFPPGSLQAKLAEEAAKANTAPPSKPGAPTAKPGAPTAKPGGAAAPEPIGPAATAAAAEMAQLAEEAAKTVAPAEETPPSPESGGIPLDPNIAVKEPENQYSAQLADLAKNDSPIADSERPPTYEIPSIADLTPAAGIPTQPGQQPATPFSPAEPAASKPGTPTAPQAKPGSPTPQQVKPGAPTAPVTKPPTHPIAQLPDGTVQPQQPQSAAQQQFQPPQQPGQIPKNVPPPATPGAPAGPGGPLTAGVPVVQGQAMMQNTGGMQAIPPSGAIRQMGGPQTGAIPRPMVDVQSAGGVRHFGWVHVGILAAVTFVLGVVVFNVAGSG